MNVIYIGDALEKLRGIEGESVQCVVTSPPYWGLRDYGHNGQIGLEKTPEEYIARLVAVFEEVRRVLKKDGTLWLNLGDSYAASKTGSFNGGGFKDVSAMTGGRDVSGVETSGKFDKLKASGLKPKDLCMIPARTAIELQRAGWWLRSEIVWHKPNPMPESVTDRPTKSHEMIYLLTKSASYYYDAEAIAEPIKESSLQRYEHAVETNEQFDPKRHKNDGKSQSPMEVLARAAKKVLERGKRNKRSVWEIPTNNYGGAHFATFPEEIPRLCIAAGSRPGDWVLDPFFGSGTTGEVALRMGRHFIGIELSEKYVREIAEPRVNNVDPLFRNAVLIKGG